MVDVTDRTELDLWLEGGPTLSSGLDGDARPWRRPRCSELSPNALDAAKEGTKRVVVWVKKPSLLSESEQKELFGKGERVLASVIG